MNARDLSKESLNTLRRIIIEIGDTYPNFGEPIPSSWMALQTKISELKQKGQRIIPLQDVEDLNSRMATPLPENELCLFTLLLHHTGFSLHFQKGNLKNLIMLDPKLIIDAMRCLVTCRRFALNVWKRVEWETMRSSGRIEERSIIDIWRKKDKTTLYCHREYLIQVMKELDLICLPKVYDKKGGEIKQTSFFIPSMVKDSPLERLPTATRIASKEALQMRFEFADILPPAVYNRLVCTSLSLWQVHRGQLYHGFVTLQSGSQHLLVIQRESQAITVSFLHDKGIDNVDIDLCRAVQLFFTQTIKRILSTYQIISDDGADDLLTVRYRPAVFSQQLSENNDDVSTFKPITILIQRYQHSSLLKSMSYLDY